VTAQAFAPSALNHPGTTRLGTTTLSLSWPVYAGGAVDDAIRAGNWGQKAARGFAQRTREHIMAGVVQAYEGLAMAQAARHIAREAVAAAARHARTTSYLLAHGRIVRSDALTASVNLGANKELLAEAVSDVETARENLALAMGPSRGHHPYRARSPEDPDPTPTIASALPPCRPDPSSRRSRLTRRGPHDAGTGPGGPSPVFDPRVPYGTVTMV